MGDASTDKAKAARLDGGKMRDTEEATILKKARQKARMLRIGVWAFVALALLSIPAPFLGVAVFFGSCAMLVGVIRNKSSIFQRRRYYSFAMFAMGLAFLAASPWRDAPPIEDDYTVADLKSAEPIFDQTFDLLTSYFFFSYADRDYDSLIGLNSNDWYTLMQHWSAPDVLPDLAEWRRQYQTDFFQMWEKTKEVRQEIRTTMIYDQIADLTTPDFFEEQSQSTRNFVNLNILYCHVVPLLIQEGHIDEGIDELISWTSFIRKLSVSARSRRVKLTCHSILISNIQTANEIINNPNINTQTIEHIREHFLPLTHDQVSLRNPLIFDYLQRVQMYKQNGFALFEKKQSSIRLLRNQTDAAIAYCEGTAVPQVTCSVWPFWLSFLPDIGADFDASRPWYYSYFNPVGAKSVTIFQQPVEWLPEMVLERLPEIILKTKISDDLLQCVLSYRLEGRADLTARAYGDEYVVDIERKRIYSSGPDRVAFTEDDIWLPIKPAVLGLVE